MNRIIPFLTLFFLCPIVLAEEVSLKKTDRGYDVLIDGRLFAGYITDQQGTPIIWPIIGPTGKKMTRDYPMIEREDNSEAKDHPHHRSFWFNHGKVNDANFWGRGKDRIVHQKFAEAECDGKTAVLVTENDWIDAKGNTLCRDTRTMRFGTTGGMRYIDFDVTVTAEQTPVVFVDTKEGSFGIRVPGTMDVRAVKRDPAWGGHIVNAEGFRDGDAWAKRSAWVDYYGPVEGETLGIAVLNHPSSFRYPTYWHVRDYGLLAANPFGEHDFKRIKEMTGELRMNKGDSFTLRYRVLFHRGDAAEAGIAEAFRKYYVTSFD